MKHAIGVCAKNEQATIISTLNSIIKSTMRLDSFESWRIFICLNGSTDQTEELVKTWLRKNKNLPAELIVLPLPNLIEAQREIVKLARIKNCDTFLFFDADIILDEFCIPELVHSVSENKVQAAYAVSIPKTRQQATLLEQSLNLYDTSPTIFTPRKHLHGRAFIIKDWKIPKVDPSLLVDDIYLSFYLLSTYGPESIRKVDTAKVGFNQVTTFRDYYRAARRRNMELRKCFTLFPHFKDLPSDQVNRMIIWKRFTKESPKRILLWLYLLGAKKLVSWMYKLDKFFNPINRPQWMVVESSKKTRDMPLLVLFEGLDCSGKKTTARMLQQELTHHGVTSIIHSGPLGPKWYNFIVRMVSLHKTPNLIRSIVYSFEGLGDSRAIIKYNTDIIIQVSSPTRSWAYARVHGKKQEFCYQDLLKIDYQITI